MKKILFTFDYELFLGEKSGSVNKCLIEPTNFILEELEAFQASGIFFIDTTYLLQLQKLENKNTQKDFDKITKQIQKLIHLNHYVFPHIHPHWLDAQYLPETNDWKLLKLEKYRFHSISNKEREVLFQNSIDLLNEIIFPIKPDYKINAYRAGGWCIQPFEDFKPFFEKHQIESDFSVLPKKKMISNAQFYDFSNAPEKAIYHFENDVLIENLNGKFKEFTISTCSFSKTTHFLNRLLLSYLWKTNNRSIGDGKGVQSQAIEQDLTAKDIQMIALENLNWATFKTYKKFLNQNDYMQFISHPKMLSKHNLAYFRKFLKYAFSNFKIETKFDK